MEKIRQALDRAQRERLETLDRGPIEESPVAALSRIQPRIANPAVADDSPGAAANGSSVAFGFVPSPEVLEANRIVAGDGQGADSAVFRSLRTQVLQRLRERGWQVVGIASARAGDGKTTLAANLALAIAGDPRYTALLVDLDLRRPSVGRVFGQEVEAGIDDVLTGGMPPERCISRPTPFPGLRLMPARAPVPESSAVLVSPRCQALLAELRSRYLNRIVVIDMPPVLEADDALNVAALVDCVLFVVAEGRTSREDVSRAMRLLSNTPVIGTVLNRSVEAVRSEAYG